MKKLVLEKLGFLLMLEMGSVPTTFPPISNSAAGDRQGSKSTESSFRNPQDRIWPVSVIITFKTSNSLRSQSVAEWAGFRWARCKVGLVLAAETACLPLAEATQTRQARPQPPKLLFASKSRTISALFAAHQNLAQWGRLWLVQETPTCPMTQFDTVLLKDTDVFVVVKALEDDGGRVVQDFSDISVNLDAVQDQRLVPGWSQRLFHTLSRRRVVHTDDSDERI